MVLCRLNLLEYLSKVIQTPVALFRVDILLIRKFEIFYLFIPSFKVISFQCEIFSKHVSSISFTIKPPAKEVKPLRVFA